MAGTVSPPQARVSHRADSVAQEADGSCKQGMGHFQTV